MGRRRPDLARFGIVAAGTLAAIVAVVWLVRSHVGPVALLSGNGSQAPDWQDVRREVLPLAAPAQAPSPSIDPASDRPRIDPRIIEIGDNLNRQFARNPGHETAFTDAYPRRMLAAWIDDQAGIPPDLRDDFVDALVDASRDIGEDPLINRIGSVPDRAQTIRDALYAYRDAYLRRADAYLRRADAYLRRAES